jgi:hypothetical protein
MRETGKLEKRKKEKRKKGRKKERKKERKKKKKKVRKNYESNDYITTKKGKASIKYANNFFNSGL